MLCYRKLLWVIGFFLRPQRLLSATRNPKFALQGLAAILRHPSLFMTTRNVEGLISWSLGVLLYETVLTIKCNSPNIVEVGAFKGLSTVYLAKAAQIAGKRVKSFELFSGLPTADPILDPSFHQGQVSSDISEYETNLRACGVRDVVDLTVGDARETMLSVIGDAGFSVAFLDVDVYEVMRELLVQLWCVVKGDETIIVHDSWSPGVRKAIDEFHTLSQNVVKERNFEIGTAILHIPFLRSI